MEKKITEIKALKKGSFVLIEDIPCKVDDVQISKPGKHGSSKAKLTASGVFTNHKKIIVKPSDAKADIPVIEKRNAQILSIQGDTAQIMDMEDYSQIDIEIPEEFKGKLTEGGEVLIWKFGKYVQIKSKK